MSSNNGQSILNSKLGSNFLTSLLQTKNMNSHKRILNAYLSGEPINEYTSAYDCLKKLINENTSLSAVNAMVQERTITYEVFWKEINNLAAFLYESWHVKKGENISICAASSIEGIVAFFAMNKLGSINARIFNGVKEDKMLYNILNFDSEVIMTDSYNLEVLSRVIKDTQIRNVLVLDDCIEMIEQFKQEHPEICVVSYEQAITSGNSLSKEYEESLTGTDLASILYTSGSSGEPKPISIPNRIYTNMVDIVCQTTNIKKCDGEKVVGVVSHEYPYAAINCTIMILLMGKTLIMPKHSDDGSIDFKDLLAEKPNRIQAIPNFYKLLQVATEEGKITSEDFAEFNSLISGGERYLDSEKQELLQFLSQYDSKPLLIDGFGFGELGSATALKFGMSQYFLLMNGIRAKSIDPETRKILPLDEEGILCFSGPTIATGYYNNDKATQESFVEDEDGVVWFVSDTYGLVHGKQKRLIKLGGRIREYFITNDGHGNFVKVYAGTVEDVVLATGVVANCVVVQSDYSAAPTPVAYVELLPDWIEKQSQAVESIMLQCKSLEKFAQPTDIHIVESIKRTRAGKKDYTFYKKLSEK